MNTVREAQQLFFELFGSNCIISKTFGGMEFTSHRLVDYNLGSALGTYFLASNYSEIIQPAIFLYAGACRRDGLQHYKQSFIKSDGNRLSTNINVCWFGQLANSHDSAIYFN